MAIESAFRPASVSPPFFLAGAAALTGAGVGAAVAAFADFSAAHRFFVPAMIARRPAALSFRFACAAGAASATRVPD